MLPSIAVFLLSQSGLTGIMRYRQIVGTSDGI
jgi:hypothetical protein